MWGEVRNNKVNYLPTLVELSEKNEKPLSGSLDEAELFQEATDQRREREMRNNKVNYLPTLVELSEKNEKPLPGSLEEAELVQEATDERREREVGNNHNTT